MKRKSYHLFAALCLCVTLTSAEASETSGAVRTYSVEAENQIGTGDVNISLKEYELDENGQEIPYRDNKTVVPGQQVDKIVKITNEADRAWIRARIDYVANGLEGMSDRMLGGISEKWIRAGEYFYYTEPTESGETVVLFRSLTVPPEWDETKAGQKFSVGVTAQAVQADNFIPDFKSDSPWFGIPVEKCVHDGYERVSNEEKQEFSVVFENGSEGFVKIGDDFFRNFSALMPGDVVSDFVELGNRHTRKIAMYFRTEIPDQPEDSRLLLEQLQLAVYKGDQQIYSGPLSGKALEDEILLVNLDQNDYERLSYRLYMPEELTNSSSLKKAKVRWIFRAEYGVSTGGSSGGGSGSRERGEIPQVPEQKEVPTWIPDIIREFAGDLLPKTGESLHLELWLMLTIGGVLLLLTVLPGKKK
mgnify:CR=1 FL=1